jgi:beta-glucanase (GH16 family)
MRLRPLLSGLVAVAALAAAGAPAVAAAGTAPTCGGTVLLKSTGAAWRCTFDDEFSGRALDTRKWVPQTTAQSGYHSGVECFVSTPNNVAVANGSLRLTVRKEAKPFTCSDPFGSYTTQYTSGMVSTWGLFSQAYGRFEVNAKLPAATVKGLQESFWLWPADPTAYGPSWPDSGEIDIAEAYSLYPDRAVPYIHYNAASPDPNVTNTSCLIANLATYHRYAVEWTPSALTILYDGKRCLVDSWHPAAPLVAPQPFDKPFLIALTQALGITTNAFDPKVTPLPATTQVDWVRVWA